jgi:poly-gamma-glutamate synthesis protein (capsule biosynthesis protein)
MVTVVAGGDVDFGRMRGQRLLREPMRDDFAPFAPLMQHADVRFLNLECPIVDRGKQTVSPLGPLVFNAPPAAADALARARIDLVSLANNHQWDFAEAGFRESLDHLDRAAVTYVGAGRERALAYAPRMIERRGVKLGFVAVTEIWNQELEPHPGKQLIVDADRDTLVKLVTEARRRGADKVIVSHHGGYEYVDQPHRQQRELFRAAVEAGADAVIGHHPHVVQAAAFIAGKPVFYSLGNMLMRMASGQPDTELGMLVQLELHREGPTGVRLCPFRMFGLDPIPLASDPARDGYGPLFRTRFERLLRFNALVEPKAAAVLGPFEADGCARLKAAGATDG